MPEATRKQAIESPAEQGKEDAAVAPPLWEWLVGLLGLVLVLAAAGYLALHALRGNDAPPDPRVQVAAVHAQQDGYVVVVRVHNRSRATASSLKVSGTLSRSGQVVEQSEADFQFLPGESTREGGLFFTLDPRQHAVAVRAIGYEKP